MQKKIEEILKQNDWKREKVERNLIKWKEHSRNQKNIEIESFTAVYSDAVHSNTFFTHFDYTLQFSWILNHESDIHVANSLMKQRFIKEKDCINGSTVITGGDSWAVEAYDQITIKMITSNEKETMTLLNVAYISSFMTNIVAESILEDKEVHFDTEHRHLHRGEIIFAFALRVKAHYVLEDNRRTFKEVIIVLKGWPRWSSQKKQKQQHHQQHLKKWSRESLSDQQNLHHQLLPHLQRRNEYFGRRKRRGSKLSPRSNQKLKTEDTIENAQRRTLIPAKRSILIKTHQRRPPR